MSQVLAAECESETRQAVARACSIEAHEIKRADMRRFKGLEWRCVVFSDGADICAGESLGEWVFTALTRATSLLVMVLWPDGDPEIKSILGRLREDRLLFWSQAARDAFVDGLGDDR